MKNILYGIGTTILIILVVWFIVRFLFILGFLFLVGLAALCGYGVYLYLDLRKNR